MKPNLYVVARFLDALARPDARLTKSQLQAAVGVNYDIFRRYLALLESKGHVRVDDVVALTAEGRRVREELRQWIARFLDEGRAGDPRTAAPVQQAASTRPHDPPH